MESRMSRFFNPFQSLPLRWRPIYTLIISAIIIGLIVYPIPTSGTTTLLRSAKEGENPDEPETISGFVKTGIGSTIHHPEAAASFEFTVTKPDDTFDGVCDSDCSLREAIAAANETLGDDIIHLPPGVYNLILDYSGAAADYGSLDITQEGYTTTILGSGRDVTIIDATMLRTVGVSFPDRVFFVKYHAGLVLVDLTVTGGYTDNFSSSHKDGGGIWNWNGYLTVTNCLIEGNVAGVNGGGIANLYGTATINNTIIRGNNTDPPDYNTSGNGGGIYNSGTMTITTSMIEDNESDWGGGISSEYWLEEYVPSVAISASTIMSNTAIHGAGILNLEMMPDEVGRETVMTISNSVITANTANRSSSFNEGGGILNMGYSSAMTITNSTISGNLVTGYRALHPKDGSRGGIHNHGGRMVVMGTTINDNVAICDQGEPGDPNLCGRGGGVINAGAGRLTITNATISGNQTTLLNCSHEPYLGGGGGGGIAHMPHCAAGYCTCPVTTIFNTSITNNQADHGGGIDTRWEATAASVYNIEEWEVEPGTYVYECPGLYALNTIVTDNTVTVTAGTADCWGAYMSGGYNLLGAGTGCPTDGPGDISTANPYLGPLSDNGGDTETHALLLASPAIDAGDPTGCTDYFGALITTDQRGYPRPARKACDIGAFEYQGPYAVFLPMMLR